MARMYPLLEASAEEMSDGSDLALLPKPRFWLTDSESEVKEQIHKLKGKYLGHALRITVGQFNIY